MQKNFGIRLSPAVKYWIFLVGIMAVIFAVILGSFIASYLHLSAAEQASVEKLFDKLLPFPFIGSIVLVAFIGTMVSLLFRYYIIPVLRMAEQTRLITAANPGYRITPEGARELTTLANVINESADAFQKLQHEFDDRVKASSAALKEERNRLAALMSELPYGVMVCSLDGRIMLYNQLANKMLQPETDQSKSVVGLGRSIFGILDKEPLVHSLEVMNYTYEQKQEQAQPLQGLMTKLIGTRFIRVNMAPVTNQAEEKRSLSGFILTLEDITGEVDADSERDRLLQDMVDSLQSSLGRLHKGLNAICTEPGTGGQACEQHRQEINRVAGDLEEHLALARQLYTEHHHAYGNRENVAADTLLTLITKSVDERFDIPVDVKAEQRVWLKIDSYATMQAITTLAGFLKSEHSLSSLTLRIRDKDGPYAGLSISWPENTIHRDAVDDWRNLPLFMGSDGTTDSPGMIIEKHGGKINMTLSGESECQGIEITLPTTMEEEHAPLQSEIAPRPVSYEFDLFHQPGQKALGQIPLRKLTYVAFDTETTGLDPSAGDEIIQIGAVRIVNGRLLHEECLDQLVNPQRPVPESSVKIHGIDPELLPKQPVISEVLPKFHAYAGDAVLVAHNAAFDMRFLQLKQELVGLRFDNPVLDTLLLSSIVHPSLKGHSLDAIAERFNIAIVGRHTALGDALVTAEILLKLIPLLEAQNIRTLDDALQASIRSPFAKISY